MTDLRRVLPVSYDGAVLLLLVLAVAGVTGHVFPHLLARHVSEDSEGWVLALLLPAWLQYVRPRLRGTAAEAPVAIAVLAHHARGGLAGDALGHLKRVRESFVGTLLAEVYLAVLLPLALVRRTPGPADGPRARPTRPSPAVTPVR